MGTGIDRIAVESNPNVRRHDSRSSTASMALTSGSSVSPTDVGTPDALALLMSGAARCNDPADSSILPPGYERSSSGSLIRASVA
jgi:hypothetical protein